jgi:hypothetical protein
VSGRPQEKDGEMKLLVESAFEITQHNIDEIAKIAKERNGGESGSGMAEQDPTSSTPSPDAEKKPAPITLHLRIHPSDDMIRLIREVCDRHPGLHPVYFRIESVHGSSMVQSPCRISWSEESVDDLEALLGPETVKAGG